MKFFQKLNAQLYKLKRKYSVKKKKVEKKVVLFRVSQQSEP